MTDLVVELVDIDSIKPDDANARLHSKRNIEVITNSLTRFGQRKPIVVWKDIVIAGNGTWHAAKEIGWAQISIARVPSKWTKTEARAFALADNRSGELADWDSEELSRQLIELDGNGFSLDEIGFSLDLGDGDYDPTSFLDEIDPGSDNSEESFGGEKDKYALPYGFDSSQREIIIEAINHAKKLHSIEAPEALTHVAKCYLGKPE